MGRINGFHNSYADMVGFRNHAGSYSGSSLFDITFNPSGQMALRPFNASGQLEYRFGSHEAWCVRTSNPVGGSPDGDGFWPIPHSGQIQQMLSENSSTLQQAYDSGRTLFITSSTGPLDVVSAEDKFTLASNGSYPEISFSGLLTPQTSNHATGDMTHLLHSDYTDGDPASLAEAKALSLGLSTMIYNTGSGLTNLVIGSGIFECKNGSQQAFSTATPLEISGAGVPDSNYYVDETNDWIVVLTPGLYWFGFQVTIKLNAGTVRSGGKVVPRLNGTTNLDGMTSYTYNRNTTTGIDTAVGFGLLLLDAGDTIEVLVSRDSGTSDLVVVANQAHINMWKIGAKRTGSLPT